MMFDMRESIKVSGGESLDPDAVDRLRELAAAGQLVAVARRAPQDERLSLNGAAYQVAFPIVFRRFTRALELRRGHYACATSVWSLEADCLDRFYNDVEAVVFDVLTRATVRIRNLEGWIVPRLRAATVNVHRRRRGERGALQRPRLPGWLVQALGHDSWLGQLAVALLTWVGVPATAGASPWPLDCWSDLRAAATGDWAGSDHATVQRDVDQVLSAMRLRPRWYADNVERPLGAKTPAVAPAQANGRAALDPPDLPLVDPHEYRDAHLAELAGIAIEAIRQRILANGDIRGATEAVVRELFGQPHLRSTLADEPNAVPDVDEQIPLILGDPRRINDIIQTVLDILRDPERAAMSR